MQQRTGIATRWQRYLTSVLIFSCILVPHALVHSAESNSLAFEPTHLVQLPSTNGEKHLYRECLAFSPEGEVLAIATGESLLFVDVTTSVIKKSTADFGLAESVAFSPTGDLIAVSYKGFVTVRSYPGGSLKLNVQGNSPVVFSPNGNILAAGNRIYDAKQGELLREFDLYAGAGPIDTGLYRPSVLDLAFSPDSQRFVIYSFFYEDELPWLHRVQLWNVADGLLGASFPGKSCSFSADGKTIAYVTAKPASVVSSCVLLNVDTQRITAGGFGHNLLAARYSPDSSSIALVSEQSLRLCNGKIPREYSTKLYEGDSKVTAFAFSSEGDMLAAAKSDGTVQIWNREWREVSEKQPLQKSAAKNSTGDSSPADGTDQTLGEARSSIEDMRRSIAHLGFSEDDTQSFLMEDYQVLAECQPMYVNRANGLLEFAALGDSTKLSDAHIMRIPQLPRIRGVHLEYAFTDRALNGLQQAQHLKLLSLKQCDMTDEAIRRVISQNRDLEFLAIRPLRSPSMRPSWSTMQVIGVLRHLESLRLDNVTASHGGLDQLSSLTHLRVLHLTSDRVDATGVKTLSRLPRLEELHLRGNLTEAMLDSIAKISTLRNLKLSKGGVDNPDAYAVLARLEKVDTLSLPRDFPEDALKHIAELPSLRVLDLAHCSKVTDKWIPELLKSKILERIELRGTSVSPEMRVKAQSLTKADVSKQTHRTEAKPDFLQVEQTAAAGVEKLGGDVVYDFQRRSNRKNQLGTFKWRHDKKQPTDHKSRILALRVPAPQHGPKPPPKPPTDAAMTEIARYCAPLKKLDSLWIDCNRLSRSGLESLGHLTQLQFLDMYSANVEDTALKFLSSLKRLQHLSVSGRRWAGGFVKYLSDAESLTFLELSGQDLSEDGLQELRALHGLQGLSVEAHNLGESDYSFVLGLRELKNLILRDVRKLTPDACDHLARLPALEKLELTEIDYPYLGRTAHRYGPVGVEQVKALSAASKLNFLMIRQSHLDTDAIRALQDTKQLKYLSLQCRLDPDAYFELKKLKHLDFLDLLEHPPETVKAGLQEALSDCRIWYED